MVGIILEGIAPEEWSRMVFATWPNSYAELDKLSVSSRMVAYTVGLRQQEQRRDWHSLNARPVMHIQEVKGPESSNRPRKDFVCWECGMKGHTSRFCRQLGRTPQQGGSTLSAQPSLSANVARPKNGVAGGGAHKLVTPPAEKILAAKHSTNRVSASNRHKSFLSEVSLNGFRAGAYKCPFAVLQCSIIRFNALVDS